MNLTKQRDSGHRRFDEAMDALDLVDLLLDQVDEQARRVLQQDSSTDREDPT